MFDTNPTLIQPPTLPFPPNTLTSRTPLILIHDGGGTTFDYFFLGNIHRSTYGIHNPNFLSGVPWDGGIPQLAGLYIEFIRALLFPKGPSPGAPSQGSGPTEIILGGWSLGGLLSLEISHQLSLRSSDNPPLKVKGIVMIDSIYPGDSSTEDRKSMKKLLPSMPVFRETCSPETKARVRRCLGLAVEMVNAWEMPRWGVKDAGPSENGTARASSASPPPAVLLRATEPIPVPGGEVSAEDAESSLDVHRRSKFLGWESYGVQEGGGYDLVKAVADVPGHHFNLFQDEENAAVVTEKIRWACDLIDRG
ncbi:putative secondary metabolism biosynthetic enzyme [Arachnomyces sp. PD_36]|nr:putative secondary metabolism biosynthetic enzyme [Arachnomyces sp. PD_36]